jgi:transcriptional regulator with XRE-family HTH domain
MAEQPPRKKPRAGAAATAEAPPRAGRRTARKAERAQPTAPSAATRQRKRHATPEPATPAPESPPAQAPQVVRAEPHARPRRGRERSGEPRSNALGLLIERRFTDPTAPVRSYSDLERRSGVSREALSRYVTARADRRRSPTIETLAAIADALRLSLEQVCRAAVAGAHGQLLPDVIEQRAREEVLMPLAGALSDSQFDALVELLRQMHSGRAGGEAPGG